MHILDQYRALVNGAGLLFQGNSRVTNRFPFIAWCNLIMKGLKRQSLVSSWFVNCNPKLAGLLIPKPMIVTVYISVNHWSKGSRSGTQRSKGIVNVSVISGLMRIIARMRSVSF